jgi:FK506-binding nuclear protein
MAAIDPDETPEFEDGQTRPRATLKLVRAPADMDMDESDDDYEDDSEEDSDDEEVNGGPSDKEKARKLREAAALKEMLEEEDDDEDDEDDDEDFDLKAAISKLVKGKAPATEDDEDDESEEGLELDEMVVCTLDPERVCF